MINTRQISNFVDVFIGFRGYGFTGFRIKWHVFWTANKNSCAIQIRQRDTLHRHYKHLSPCLKFPLRLASTDLAKKKVICDVLNFVTHFPRRAIKTSYTKRCKARHHLPNLSLQAVLRIREEHAGQRNLGVEVYCVSQMIGLHCFFWIMYVDSRLVR